MDNTQGGYRYPSIQMRKSPNNKMWWAMGLLALLTVGTFLFKGNLSSFQPQQTPTPTPSPTETLTATPTPTH